MFWFIRWGIIKTFYKIWKKEIENITVSTYNIIRVVFIQSTTGN